MTRFDQDMASGAYTEQIKKGYYESIINGISGAPTTFINGVLYALTGVELLAAVPAIAQESLPVISHPM